MESLIKKWYWSGKASVALAKVKRPSAPVIISTIMVACLLGFGTQETFAVQFTDTSDDSPIPSLNSIEALAQSSEKRDTIWAVNTHKTFAVNLHESLETTDEKKSDKHLTLSENVGLDDSEKKHTEVILSETIAATDALPLAAGILKNITDSLMFAYNTSFSSKRFDPSPWSDSSDSELLIQDYSVPIYGNYHASIKASDSLVTRHLFVHMVPEVGSSIYSGLSADSSASQTGSETDSGTTVSIVSNASADTHSSSNSTCDSDNCPDSNNNLSKSSIQFSRLDILHYPKDSLNHASNECGRINYGAY